MVLLAVVQIFNLKSFVIVIALNFNAVTYITYIMTRTIFGSAWRPPDSAMNQPNEFQSTRHAWISNY